MDLEATDGHVKTWMNAQRKGTTAACKQAARTMSAPMTVLAILGFMAMDGRAKTWMNAKLKHITAVCMLSAQIASVHSAARVVMDMKVLVGLAMTSMSVRLKLTNVTLALVVLTSQARTAVSAKEGTQEMDGIAQVTTMKSRTSKVIETIMFSIEYKKATQNYLRNLV